ncbi:MAG: thiamine phosphate synthase [Hyphomicrobiales bacterium]|nr:thiamine phosphate synthase [Hyphomicrobiales bacterium]
MATRPSAPEPARLFPRLMLIAPSMADPARFNEAVVPVLAAVDIAAAVLPFTCSDERLVLNGLKALAPVVQGAGAALLLGGHADLVGRAGADGAHLTGLAAFTRAVASLKPGRIAGCGGLTSRHDAMVAAEAGADYVMFGEPGADGRRPPRDAVAERVAWWAEVFEVPCVAYAATLADVTPLAMAGADFVAVGSALFDDPRGPAVAAREAAASLIPTEPVP